MLLRIKNSASAFRIKTAATLRLVLLCLCLTPAFAPQPAQAYNFYQPTVFKKYYDVNTNSVKTSVCPGVGLTRRVVPCIKETIVSAVYMFLVPFSQYMSNVIAICCTLAITLWGFAAISGKQGVLTRDMTVLMLKIFFVSVFTSNFGGMFPALLDAIDNMLSIVSYYAINMSSVNASCPNLGDPSILQVWDTVDCAIELLVGSIYSPYTLAMGIAGFLFACLFSGTAGMFIAVIGVYIVIVVMYAIARAMYIFISSYMAFALMVMISPIFIPMVLFSATKGYFDKWVRLIGVFLVQPIVLFAYLSMLVAAMDVVVFNGPTSVYRTIAGSAVDKPNFKMGAWLAQSAYGTQNKLTQGVDINPQLTQAILGTTQPLDTGTIGEIAQRLNKTGSQLQKAMDLKQGQGIIGVSWPTTAVDWDFLAGAQKSIYMQNGVLNTNLFIANVVLAFIMALLTIYIFKNILDHLPYIIGAIAGSGEGLPTLGMGRLAPPGGSMIDTFNKKMTDAMQKAKIP